MDNEEYLTYLQSLTQLLSQQEVKESIKQKCDYFRKNEKELYDDYTNVIEIIAKDFVKELLSAKTIISRQLKKTDAIEWLRRYCPTIKDAEALIESLSMEQRKREIFTIAQLLEMSKAQPSKFIVKGLLQLGALYLLVAAPKTGKSLLATTFGVNIAQGKDVLNRQSQQSNVLYLQNEENITTTTIKRIINHGFQVLELENPNVYNEFIQSEKLIVARNYDLVLDFEEIIEIIKEKNIQLLLVDSLGVSIRKSGLTETSPEIVAMLYQLQAACHRLNFTCVVLHHETKLGSAESNTSKIKGVAGHNGLARANDGMFFLHPEKSQPGAVNLSSIPRDAEPVKITLKYTREEANYWYYEVVKENSLSKENIDIQNRILKELYERWNAWVEEFQIVQENLNEQYLKENGIPMPYGYTMSDLVDLLAIERPKVVQRLNDMLDTEAVITYIQRGQGSRGTRIYSIPVNGESWLQYYLEKEKEDAEKAELKRQELEAYNACLQQTAQEIVILLNDDNIVEIEKKFNELNNEEKVDVQKLLTNEQREKLILLRYPPKYNINDRVVVLNENRIEYIQTIKVKGRKDNGKKVFYHIYYLTNISERTFSEEQIELYEN